MAACVTLLMAVHSHQPVGNFDGVFEVAFARAYEPFLRTLERHPGVRLALHYSGPLLDWLSEHRPEFLARVRTLVGEGRVELLASGYYEPILPVIPEHDRRGQIALMHEALRARFGVTAQGLWLAERVWEPQLPETLAAAGIRYTILDVTQFTAVRPSLPRALQVEDGPFWDLVGCYMTTYAGSRVIVFPASKRLRYWIPFQPVAQTIDALRRLQADDPVTVTFADDGEKFGLWPNTNAWVYDAGWLETFFDALEREGAWLRTATFQESLETIGPRGTVCLPSSSYDEMMEWSGGQFRNFFTRYPEANAMYQKMLRVSAAIRQLEDQLGPGRGRSNDQRPTPGAATSGSQPGSRRGGRRSAPGSASSHGGLATTGRPGAWHAWEAARRQLYAGQCNCAYWHGVFGGLYLSHLRRAVYRHLIHAQQLIEQAASQVDADPTRQAPRVRSASRRAGSKRTSAGEAATRAGVTALDADGDGRHVVRLKTEALELLIDPDEGGTLTEWSLSAPRINLLDTLSRRAEPYHATLRRARGGSLTDVLAKLTSQAGSVAGPAAAAPTASEMMMGLHEALGIKDDDLTPHLVYDDHRRSAFVDYALGHLPTLRETMEGTWARRRVWRNAPFRWHRSVPERPGDARLSVVMQRELDAGMIRKTIRVERETADVEFLYELHGLSAPVIGLEFNLSLRDERYLAVQAQQRYFVTSFDVREPASGLSLTLSVDPPAVVLSFPVETVSESEQGLERTYQGLCVVCFWVLEGAGAAGSNGMPSRVARMGVTRRRRSPIVGHAHGAPPGWRGAVRWTLGRA